MRIQAAVISVLLLVLSAPLSSAAQRPGSLNLSTICFDSLPYGVEHACDIVFPKKTTASLGALYATMAALVAADGLVIARRDSGQKGVAIIVSPQPATRTCLDSTRGPAPRGTPGVPCPWPCAISRDTWLPSTH